MSGHTPGPWRARCSFSLDFDFSVVADSLKKTHVLRLTTNDDPTELAIGKANSDLIAAAPELLNELRAFEQLITGFSRDNGNNILGRPFRLE